MATDLNTRQGPLTEGHSARRGGPDNDESAGRIFEEAARGWDDYRHGRGRFADDDWRRTRESRFGRNSVIFTQAILRQLGMDSWRTARQVAAKSWVKRLAFIGLVMATGFLPAVGLVAGWKVVKTSYKATRAVARYGKQLTDIGRRAIEERGAGRESELGPEQEQEHPRAREQAGPEQERGHETRDHSARQATSPGLGAAEPSSTKPSAVEVAKRLVEQSEARVVGASGGHPAADLAGNTAKAVEILRDPNSKVKPELLVGLYNRVLKAGGQPEVSEGHFESLLSKGSSSLEGQVLASAVRQLEAADHDEAKFVGAASALVAAAWQQEGRDFSKWTQVLRSAGSEPGLSNALREAFSAVGQSARRVKSHARGRDGHARSSGRSAGGVGI